MTSCISVKVPNPMRNGLPGRPTVVLDTVVDVPPEPPKDHIIWSFLCFIYLNPLCLGLAALICSIKAREQKAAGNLDGARRCGCIAFWLNIIASALVASLVITLLIHNGGFSWNHHLYYKIRSYFTFMWFP